MSNKKSHRYIEQTEEVRNRLAGRDYVLGLDLGVGSIGLAVVAEEPIDGVLYPSEIVFTSSRIFTPSAGAASRRMSRLQRNAIRHKKHRLQYLWKLLATKGLMLPFSDEKKEDPAELRFPEAVRKENPYQLRFRGLREELSLEELGYAVYHIANHRGSSAIRTFLDSEESADEKKAKEQERKAEEIARANNLSTFVEVLMAFNQDQVRGFRNKQKRANADVPMPTRDIISSELRRLLKIQQQFHPELDDDFCQQVVDAVMYENKKIVPEAGNCPYFPNEKKLPRCHFLNEERRLWEALNNARVLIPVQVPGRYCVNIENRQFSWEQRRVLFSHLRNGETLTGSVVKRLFPQYRSAEILLQGRDKKRQQIEGFRFKNLEGKPFWGRLSEKQKDDFFATWVNTPDDGKLKRLLVSDRFALSESEADDALQTVHLVGDYAPIGKTAMQLVMKHIEEGKTYIEAVDQCIHDGELKEQAPREVCDRLPYYGQVLPASTQALMGKAWHSSYEDAFATRPDQFHKPDINYLEAKYGRIANPVVHQTLNQLRKMVNELLEVLGKKPSEIVVEVGRELKVGQEKREEISKEQQTREKEAARIFTQYCETNAIPADKKKSYIQKFRLFEQQKETCPYCLQQITVDQIVRNDADIDHILPKAETADSREQNLVLAHKNCNKTKGKRTPYAAFASSDKWSEILQNVQTNENMKGKAWRFELNDEAYHAYLQSKGFLSRFGTDNSYIAKMAMQYLACLFEKPSRVRTIKGGETALLRKAWHLQVVDNWLADLHGPSSETVLDKKDRTDNRHHSLDAIVAAFCSRSNVQRINTMYARGMLAEDIADSIPLPAFYQQESLSYAEQCNSFRKQVFAFLCNHGFVSYRIDNQRNGTLLNATRYSVLATAGENLICVVKKKVADLKVKDGSLDEIQKAIHGIFVFKTKLFASSTTRVKAFQEHNEKVLQQYEEVLDLARQQLLLLNKEAKTAGRREIPINPISISKKALELCGGCYYLLSNNLRAKVFVTKEPTFAGPGEAFDTGSNLCLDLYHDAAGKLKGEIIRKVYGMDESYIPAYRKAGFKLVERFYQGDIVEIQLPQKENAEEKDNKIVVAAKAPVGNAAAGRRFMKIQTFTEVGNGIQIWISNTSKSQGKQDASFMVNTLKKYCVRKATLSPLGFVEFVSPVLTDAEP